MKFLTKSALLALFLGNSVGLFAHNFTIINRVINYHTGVENYQPFVPIYVDLYGSGSLKGTMFGGHVGLSWQGAGTLDGAQYLKPRQSKIFTFNSWDWGVCLEKILAGYEKDELMEVEIREVDNAHLQEVQSALENLSDTMEKSGKAIGGVIELTPSHGAENAAKETTKTAIEEGAHGVSKAVEKSSSDTAVVIGAVAGAVGAVANPEAAVAAAAVQAATGIFADALRTGTKLYKGSYCRNRTFTIVIDPKDPNKKKLIAISRP